MPDTAVKLPFADGDYTFFLPMPRVVAAEREIKGSIFELFAHLGDHLGAIAEAGVLVGPSPAKLGSCHALIRNALIGGGLSEDHARELVETYCYPARPAISDLMLAFNVLQAAVYGVQLKKNANEPAPRKQRRSAKAR